MAVTLTALHVEERVRAGSESGDPFSSQAYKCGMEPVRLLKPHDLHVTRPREPRYPCGNQSLSNPKESSWSPFAGRSQPTSNQTDSTVPWRSARGEKRPFAAPHRGCNHSGLPTPTPERALEWGAVLSEIAWWG